MIAPIRCSRDQIRASRSPSAISPSAKTAPSGTAQAKPVARLSITTTGQPASSKREHGVAADIAGAAGHQHRRPVFAPRHPLSARRCSKMPLNSLHILYSLLRQETRSPMNKIASACGALLALGLLAGCADTGDRRYRRLGHPFPSRPADRARPRSRSRPSDPAETEQPRIRAIFGRRRTRAQPARLDGRAGQGPLRAGRDRPCRASVARGGAARRLRDRHRRRHRRLRPPWRRSASAAARPSRSGGTANQVVGDSAQRAHPAPLRRDRRLGRPRRNRGPRWARRSPARAPAVDRLAAALFRDFPGESGRTIRVR